MIKELWDKNLKEKKRKNVTSCPGKTANSRM